MLRGWTRWAGTWLPLVSLFTALGVALSAPAWLDPLRVMGHPESDVWKHLWGDDWFLRELGTAWPVPIRTMRLWAPDGGLLYNLDPLTGAACRLLAPWSGLVLAHDLAQLGALVLGALAATALAHRLVADRAAALLAGAIYGFSAHIQAGVFASGIGETAHIAWLPLSLWLVLAVLQRPRWWLGALLSLCLFLSALGSWYYGMATSLAASALVLAWLGGRLSTRRRGQSLAPLWRPLVMLLVAAGLALAGVLPFARVFAQTLSDPAALHGLGGEAVAGLDFTPSRSFAVATLRDFLVPGARVQASVDRLFFSNHPGFIPLALAGFATLVPVRRARALAVGALLAASLSLGPDIWWDRSTILGVNPPFRLLQLVWPRFEMVRNLERFQVAFTLCLALLASMGWRRLLDIYGLEGMRRQGLAVALAVMVVLEANAVTGLGLPLPTADTRASPLLTALAGDTGEFAVLELPIQADSGGLPFWHQVIHGRGLPMNMDGSPAPSLRDNYLLSRLMPDEAFGRYFLLQRKRRYTPFALEEGRQGLVDAGFRYVLLGEDGSDTQRALLDLVCGSPLAVDTDFGLSLYGLQEGVAPAGL